MTKYGESVPPSCLGYVNRWCHQEPRIPISCMLHCFTFRSKVRSLASIASLKCVNNDSQSGQGMNLAISCTLVQYVLSIVTLIELYNSVDAIVIVVYTYYNYESIACLVWKLSSGIRYVYYGKFHHFVCISLDEQRNITYITGAVAIVFTEDIFASDLYIDIWNFH